jgi:hypothetical protein
VLISEATHDGERLEVIAELMRNRPEKDLKGETIWQEYRRRARPMIVDLLLWITAIAALLIVFVALKVLEAAGYGHDRIEVLETIHYIGSAGILILFAFDVFMKMVALLTGGQ